MHRRRAVFLAASGIVAIACRPAPSKDEKPEAVAADEMLNERFVFRIDGMKRINGAL